MREEQIFIQEGDLHLEALWFLQDRVNGVLICHPHPQYGGSMHNNVVEAAVRAFADLNFTTVRFNFRGVGQSAGEYGDGIGEQEDVEAAYTFLKDKGVKHIIVAGYSFGGWVAAHSVKELQARGLLLISPPIAVLDLDFLNLSMPFWVICGDRDSFCPLDKLKPALNGAPHLMGTRWISGADHFYWGHENKIQTSIKEWFGETGH